VADLRERNLKLRQQRGGRRFPAGALAFADAGVDGIIFGFNTRAPNTEVFAWYPITGECELKAGSLRDFLFGWVAGKISL
jgi:hypothetical protein